MLSLKSVKNTMNMKVFTDQGDYFGEVEEAIITDKKVYGWKIHSTSNSIIAKIIGSAKGVIVPHNLVKCVSDIMLISYVAVPGMEKLEKSNTGEEQSE
jgi:sporulation protein YlmC with PRC-barrel domain